MMTKTKSADRPQNGIARLAFNAYTFIWNVEETVNGFMFDQVFFDHMPERGEVINACIQDRYPNGEEQALQRKGILNREDPEFVDYLAFVEFIKAQTAVL